MGPSGGICGVVKRNFYIHEVLCGSAELLQIFMVGVGTVLVYIGVYGGSLCWGRDRGVVGCGGL